MVSHLFFIPSSSCIPPFHPYPPLPRPLRHSLVLLVGVSLRAQILLYTSCTDTTVGTTAVHRIAAHRGFDSTLVQFVATADSLIPIAPFPEEPGPSPPSTQQQAGVQLAQSSSSPFPGNPADGACVSCTPLLTSRQPASQPRQRQTANQYSQSRGFAVQGRQIISRLSSRRARALFIHCHSSRVESLPL